jgi:hypothetical protein
VTLLSVLVLLYVTVPVQVSVDPMATVPFVGVSAMLTDKTVTGALTVTV